MKRHSFWLITLAIFFAFALNAQAAELRTINIVPELAFDGTTAYCFANCKAPSTSDKIDATLTLYQGTASVDSWSDSGTGSLYIAGNCKVQQGKTYKLVLTCSINGVEQPAASVTATCR